MNIFNIFGCGEIRYDLILNNSYRLPENHSNNRGASNNVIYRATPEQFVEYLETGDLIFVSGRSWISFLIKLSCLSKWTHVAMIDMCDEHEGSKLDKCMMFESLRTTDGCTDVITLTNTKSGVRLAKFEDMIKIHIQDITRVTTEQYLNYTNQQKHDFKPYCSMGILKLNATPEIKNIFRESFALFQLRESPKDYEYEKFNLARSQYYALIGHNKIDTNSYICSELVMECYKFAGLLPPLFNSSDITPAYIVRNYTRIPMQNCSLYPFVEFEIDCKQIYDGKL